MKKSTLLRKVAAETGVPYATVKRVVDATLSDITDSLHRGERVVLSGFGTFALRPYRARQWVNPQTGRQIDIPAALRPGFVSSAALKRRLVDVDGANADLLDEDDDDSDEEAEEMAEPAPKRARRGGRTSAAAAARG